VFLGEAAQALDDFSEKRIPSFFLETRAVDRAAALRQPASRSTYNNRAKHMATAVKRVYEKPSPADGTRVLVDRLWPRGLTKQAAALDAWLKELAPSDELRRWSHAHREAWLQFRKRYLKELARPEASEQLQQLYLLARKRKRLTLLYAFSDEEHNNAVVLKDLLDGMKKPPTGTGPAAAGAVRIRKAARRPM
jgi:uncharacterized protein YeaO (DUF488 family)